MKYVIQDVESGSFVSSNSIYVDGKILYYSLFTGRHFGLNYYNTIDQAEEKIIILNKILKRYKIHKILKVIEINNKNINIGERKLEKIYL